MRFVVFQKGYRIWVSCVRFIPATASPRLVRAAWDDNIKVWDLDMNNGGALVKRFATSRHVGYGEHGGSFLRTGPSL